MYCHVPVQLEALSYNLPNVMDVLKPLVLLYKVCSKERCKEFYFWRLIIPSWNVLEKKWVNLVKNWQVYKGVGVKSEDLVI